MIAFLRIAFLGFVALTVLYVMVGIYARSLRREWLEEEWERQGKQGDRDAFVRTGMVAYNASLRPKLLLGIYIVPTIVVGIIIYYVNDY